MNGLDLWGPLVAYDSFNLALVQEARSPADGTVAEVVPSVAEPWNTSGWKSRSWRTAVAALSPNLKLRPRKMMAGLEMSAGAFEVSRPGTLTVADVMRDEADVLTVASVYGAWESPPGANRPIYADASAHRLLSDLAQLVTTRRGHRLVLAGDLNVLYGYGEHGDPYWAGRYQTVFDRAAAMGLVFVGPQAPNGRQATPWPEEAPSGQPERPDVPSLTAEPSHCHSTTGLCFRVTGLGRPSPSRCLERGGRLGTKRSLPRIDPCRCLNLLAKGSWPARCQDSECEAPKGTSDPPDAGVGRSRTVGSSGATLRS